MGFVTVGTEAVAGGMLPPVDEIVSHREGCVPVQPYDPVRAAGAVLLRTVCEGNHTNDPHRRLDF